MQRIKEEVFRLWKAVNEVTDSLPITSFKQEIRGQYGDLRRLSTWRQAFGVLQAKLYVICHADDGQFMIEVQIIKASHREGWRDLVAITIEQLCAIPEGLQALRDGLEEIYKHGPGYRTTQDDLKELFGNVALPGTAGAANRAIVAA